MIKRKPRILMNVEIFMPSYKIENGMNGNTYSTPLMTLGVFKKRNNA